jgi:hypothetical protein
MLIDDRNRGIMSSSKIMKNIHRYCPWHLLLLVILSMLGIMMFASSSQVSAQSGSVASSAVVSNNTPAVGDQITVDINIDVTNVDAPDDALGSFTASLDWDPAVLAYDSDSGILAGFTGVINPSSDQIVFNGAKPVGATGNNLVLTITFDVIGAGISDLDLEYSAMAAAFTFADLLPLLFVNDDYVQVSSTKYGLFMPVVLGN